MTHIELAIASVQYIAVPQHTDHFFASPIFFSAFAKTLRHLHLLLAKSTATDRLDVVFLLLILLLLLLAPTKPSQFILIPRTLSDHRPIYVGF